MDPRLTPLPDAEPTVLVVDPSPLIHLAMIGVLDLPLRFCPECRRALKMLGLVDRYASDA